MLKKEIEMPVEQEHLTLIEYLKLIPDFVWALFAVVVGAILSWVPLYRQLKHDSEEREKERIMSLRRDVYFSAVSKIGQQIHYLVSFYNITETSTVGYYEAIQKIDVIGSDETIVALNQFNDNMVEAFLELIPMKEEINLLEDRGKLLTQMTGQSIEEINKNVRRYEKVCERKIRLTYDLAAKCQQKAQRAEKLLTPVIVAIRKEINTPFDEEAYRAMMETSHDKWKEGVENYIASMTALSQQGIKTLIKEAGLTTDSTDSTKDDDDSAVSTES
jgi:exonuclease VII small subunit